MLKLEVLAGPMTGESFVLNRTMATVGRGEEADVCLASDPRVPAQRLCAANRPASTT